MAVQSQFLGNIKDIADAVRKIVRDPDVPDIYMTGPTLRLVMDAIFTSLDNDDVHCETYLVLPALTGSEYLGSSFLYQLYRLASKIRIAPQATHCMICARSVGILISPGPADKQSACAILTTEPDAAQTMYDRCKQLFKNGLSLRLTQREQE